MVSIILPCYNCQNYIGHAIDSVIGQSYSDWELLVVDDGSTDNSPEIIKSRTSGDARIKTFHQVNSGVSKARNVALSHARGEFICMLDADDWLPPNSLEVRVNKFKEAKENTFVDGSVKVFDETGGRIERTWNPAFRGNPHKKLLRLSPDCFFGLTWMIRWNSDQSFGFDERLKHGEDLLFYTKLIDDNSVYDYVEDVIYCCRNRADSAMKNTEGLAEGYLALRDILTDDGRFRFGDRMVFEYKIKKIMFLTYIRSGSIAKALQYLVR